MPLNIKNAAVERLAAEVAELASESKTQAIRRALEERRARLLLGQSERGRMERWFGFLEREVWPLLGAGKPISKTEREAILGYGKKGV